MPASNTGTDLFAHRRLLNWPCWAWSITDNPPVPSAKLKPQGSLYYSPLETDLKLRPNLPGARLMMSCYVKKKKNVELSGDLGGLHWNHRRSFAWIISSTPPLMFGCCRGGEERDKEEEEGRVGEWKRAGRMEWGKCWFAQRLRSLSHTHR